MSAKPTEETPHEDKDPTEAKEVPVRPAGKAQVSDARQGTRRERQGAGQATAEARQAFEVRVREDRGQGEQGDQAQQARVVALIASRLPPPSRLRESSETPSWTRRKGARARPSGTGI